MTTTMIRNRRLLTVLTAAAAALATWAVADPLLGIEVSAADETTGRVRQVGPVAVTVAGLLAGFAGWGLLAVLQRFTRRARGLWTTIASGVFVVSLLGTTGATSTAAQIVLLGLHAVVAAVVIWGLRGSVPSTPVAPRALREEVVR